MILKEISFGLWRLSCNTIALPKRQLQKWVLTWLPKPHCFLLEDRKHPTVTPSSIKHYHHSLSDVVLMCRHTFPHPHKLHTHQETKSLRAASGAAFSLINQRIHFRKQSYCLHSSLFLLRKWLQLWGFNFGLFELERQLQINGNSDQQVVTNPPANAWNVGNADLVPGLGRHRGLRNGNPLQHTCP